MKKQRDKIVDLLCYKASHKQAVYQNGQEILENWKAMAQEIAGDLEPRVTTVDDRVLVSYKERSPFEFMLKAGGDAVLTTMHSNVFAFSQEHEMWKKPYLQEDPRRGYFSVFHFYNFMSDSLKYNRLKDLGILLCRVFVNSENHFILEGREELSDKFQHLSNNVLNRANMSYILENLLITAIEEDLIVPDYQDVMAISVNEMNELEQEVRHKTSKPIGYIKS